MKRSILIVLTLFPILLMALTINIDNPQIELEITNGYTQLSNSEQTIFQESSGAPAIPLLGLYTDAENASEISEINIKPLGIKTIQLEKPLYPIQKPYALSFQNNDFTPPNPDLYQSIYPQSWLHNSSLQFCGDQSIATISVFSCRYDVEQNQLLIPSSFEIEIKTKGSMQTVHQQNSVTSEVLDQLGITANPREPSGYLVIAPQLFADTVQPLLDWRFKQGWETYLRNVEEIESSYQGEDLPAKIRACISEMQSDYAIDYVTLAGDTDFIPVRYAFAFDCAYGAHDGENDLACDMYYSCLDGNWNADADTLYGEDEDEVDLLPEVYVGRIPANDEQELLSYISKLISYEKGLITDYERAGGLSMELWEGSNSEICQQYIYDNYFPAEYDIEFLYGDENNSDNAFAMINSGKNIIQHTGHAWTNILSLENYNRIYANNVPDLTNDWGGMFYSIGCWSNAFDYSSVGEAFVITPERNFLGYIGNSSYGWGAPGAPAFGFSEFYQKEFFSVLFTEDQMELGKAQALQKIPYLPYFTGTSVFKWVGYELNLCGDSAALLNTHNPEELHVSVNRIDNSLYATVKDENWLPVENAVISSLGDRWITGADGSCILPWNNGQEFNHSVFARGYRWLSISNHDVQQNLQLNLESIPTQLDVNTEQEILLSLTNPEQGPVDFFLNVECEDLQIDYDPLTLYHAEAGETVQLNPINVFYDGSANYPNGTAFEIVFDIHDDPELFLSRRFNLNLRSGDFSLIEANWYEDDFYQGNSNMPISFEFTSHCNLNDVNYILIDLQQPDEYLTFETEEYYIYPDNITEGQTVGISNILQISNTLPEEYFTTLDIGITINWGNNSEWNASFPYCIGNSNLQMLEDFETELSWEGSPIWQRVDTWSVSGDYSLSCRPEEAGAYQINSPNFTWTPNSTLTFNYKYKMPMYGEDGFFLRLVTDDFSENIIFLGSGGALTHDENRPESQVYIESDWQTFSFDLEDVLLQTPQAGSTCYLQFDFNCSEIIEDFSDYANMPEVGVFIDDLQYEQTGFYTEENDHIITPSKLKVYPNPFYANTARSLLTLDFMLEEDQQVKIDLYDLKGRHSSSVTNSFYQSGLQSIKCDVSSLPSGIYFMRMKLKNTTSSSKILILR